MGRMLVGLIFGAIMLLYLIFFVWQASYVYENTTFGTFDSYPGILLLALRIIACLGFIYLCFLSYRKSNHSVKKGFIFRFGLFYTLWMIALPTCIAFVQVAPWNERKWWNALVYLCFNFIGMAVLQFMIWPSRVRSYFDLSSRLARARAANEEEGFSGES